MDLDTCRVVVVFARNTMGVGLRVQVSIWGADVPGKLDRYCMCLHVYVQYIYHGRINPDIIHVQMCEPNAFRL